MGLIDRFKRKVKKYDVPVSEIRHSCGHISMSYARNAKGKTICRKCFQKIMDEGGKF